MSLDMFLTEGIKTTRCYIECKMNQVILTLIEVEHDVTGLIVRLPHSSGFPGEDPDL